MEHIKTLCGQNEGSFSVKPAVRYYVCKGKVNPLEAGCGPDGG